MGDWTDFASALREYAEDFEVTFHDSYSGQGMVGCGCVAISGDFGALFELVTEAATNQDFPAIAPCRDSMGTGEVWYWPEWKIHPPTDSETETAASEGAE